MRLIAPVCLFALVFVSGCASNNYLNSPGHSAFLNGKYVEAAELFEKEIPKTNTNKLLFNLDAGTSYFNAGQYEKAIPFLLQAVKFWESKDYISITESTGGFLISENVKTYIGEDYERVLIHVFLALSYAGLEKYEDAQVEARRIDLLLKKMRDQEKKSYSESAFARYLSALFWEASGDWDAARIDYEKAFEIDSEFPNIQQDLLRACKVSGHNERYDFYKKKFKEVHELSYDRKKSELVVFISYGLSSIKSAQGSQTSLPILVSRSWHPVNVEVEVGTKLYNESQTFLDIDDLMKKFLDVKLKWLTARKLIGLGIKAGAGYAVGKVSKSQDLGILTFLALSALDTTDLRGWNTLPAGIKIIKVPLDAGFHKIKISVKSISGDTLNTIDLGQKRFLPGKKVFAIVRGG